MPNAYQEYYDTYIETMVKRRKRLIDYLKIVGILAAAFLLVWFFVACFVYLQNIFPVLLAALTIFATYLALMIQNVEYEYDFTMGDLDISMIYSKRRRTRMINIKSNVFEEFGPCHEGIKTTLRARTDGKTYRALSYQPDAKVYYLLFRTTAGKTACLLFEPTGEMVAAMEKQMKKVQMMRKFS